MDLPFSRNFRQRHPQLSRGLGVGLAFGIAFVLGFGYSSWALVCRAGACPSVDVLEEYQPRQTSKLFAADGRFIAELGLERRTLLKLDQIPPMVRNAFIDVEDKRFYQHAGVDFMRIPGALVADIRKRSFAEGFSTITMQLARHIFPERLSREKSLVRKSEAGDVAPYFVEWVRQQLEQQFGQRLYEQGLKVYTTLDVDLQSAAERALENQLKAVESGRYGAYNHPTFESYMSKASS